MANGTTNPWLIKLLSAFAGLVISAGTAFIVATRQQAVDHAQVEQNTQAISKLRDQVQTIEIEQAGQRATMQQLVNDMGEVKRDVKQLLQILIARR